MSENERQPDDEAEPDGTPKLIRCEHTGALILAPEESTPVTTEDVKRMLEDFP